MAASLSVSRSGPLPAKVVVTIAAVAIAGTCAAMVVTPALFLCTAGVIAVLLRSAARSRARPEPSDDFAEFPPAARAAVQGAMRELGDGDARRLLLGVAVQARPIFANRSTLLDQQAEDATRDNAAALVAACCSTALELARLDTAHAGAAANAATPSVAAIRGQMADRLAKAAAALTSLYVAGLEHGSEASNRVSELVDEITADASARRAAREGIGEALRTRN